MVYKNNPFNIRWSVSNNWKGQLQPKNGFCQFDSIENGFRAFWILLRNYKKRYNIHTISALIRRFAPESENPTDAYIKYVQDYVNKDLPFLGENFDVLETWDWLLAAIAMFQFEQGRKITSVEKQLLNDSFTKYFLYV